MATRARRLPPAAPRGDLPTVLLREAALRSGPRLGVTGHTALTPTTVDLVATALRNLLGLLHPPVVGVSCLARGADRIFADSVLELGGHLEVLLPSLDYRYQIADAAELAHYDYLVASASRVKTLPYGNAGPMAYSAASSALVQRVDRLIAVWDGAPDRRLGCTAAAVSTARAAGVPVTVVWPDGARRANRVGPD